MSRLASPVIFSLLLLLIAATAGDWLLEAWRTSPLDASGRYLFAAGILWIFGVLGVAKRAEPYHLFAVPYLFGAMILCLAGLWLDIQVLWVIGLLWVGWSLIGLLSGPNAAFWTAFPTLVAILGVPVVIFGIERLRVHTGLTLLSGTDLRNLLAVVLISGALAAFFLRGKFGTLVWGKTAAGYLFGSCLVVLALSAGLRSANLGPAFYLNLDRYAYADWIGADIALTPAEARFFEGATYAKRVYSKSDGASVLFFDIATDDVHQLHTPEYCWTGSGWRILDRRAVEPTQNPYFNGAATELRLEKGGQEIHLVYWFTAGQQSTGNLVDLRVRKGIQNIDHLSLQIVSSLSVATDNQQQILTDFMEVVSAQL